MKQIIFETRADFRVWLAENALSDEGIWLVFGKQKSLVTLKAAEALEEALCFGWIDGQMQSVDEVSYIKYFKQRRENSNWSEKNKKIVEELEQKGMMTDFGRAKIEAAKQNRSWDTPKPNQLTEEQIQQFDDMVKPFSDAYANFTQMSQSMRKTYISSYFFGAKTEEGKKNRFDTIIERLNLNLNPMESMKKKLNEIN